MDVVQRSSFSPVAATTQTHHPPSVLTFLYNLFLYTYTRIYNHGCKSLKGFGYVSPLNTAPCETDAVLGKMFGNKEMRLLMLGLDAAGKTSTHPRFSCRPACSDIAFAAILYKLKLNQSVTTIPTGASASHYISNSGSRSSS